MELQPGRATGVVEVVGSVSLHIMPTDAVAPRRAASADCRHVTFCCRQSAAADQSRGGRLRPKPNQRVLLL